MDVYLEIILGCSKSTTDVLFTLQINLFFSIVTMDSLTVFSDGSYIKQLNFLPSSMYSIGSISVLKLHLLVEELALKEQQVNRDRRRSCLKHKFGVT